MNSTLAIPQLPRTGAGVVLLKSGHGLVSENVRSDSFLFVRVDCRGDPDV